MNKKQLLKLFLLIFVLSCFVVYFLINKEQFSRIGSLNFIEIALIVLGQSVVIISNVFILMILVSFIRKRINFLDASRVTAYSSLINFFGFLQGGVGFRGIYLKRYYKMSIKRYAALTLTQYIVFFGIAGVMLGLGLILTSGISKVLFVLSILLLLGVATFTVLQVLKPSFYINLLGKVRKATITLQFTPLLGLFIAIVFQLCGSLLSSAVELNAIGANISFGGLLVYTGVSQFAIVFALTPGAIGIREGILLIVQNQMSLSADNIIVASAIDRLVYFITLGIFTPLALSAKKKIPENI